MAINKETQTIIKVIALKTLKAELKKVADKNNRSMSAQIVTYIQEGIRGRNNNEWKTISK